MEVDRFWSSLSQAMSASAGAKGAQGAQDPHPHIAPADAIIGPLGHRRFRTRKIGSWWDLGKL